MKRTWVLILFLLLGCIDQIEVDVSAEPDKIVVDGFISGTEGEYLIKVSKTNKFSNSRNTKVTDAVVKIINSNGEEEILEEQEPGFYYTRPDFKAIDGILYIIRVETEGKIIESYEQQLPESAPLEMISYVPDTRITQRNIDNKLLGIPGISVITYLNEVEGKDNYYLWDLSSTFIYDARLARNEAFRRCWITNENDFQDILIHHDQEGGYNHEISFVEANRDMLIGYSLRVTQYNISEDAFDYWEKIKNQRENVGSIFDPPPFSITGNLYNTLDNKDVILGYFGVYHVSSKRIYLTTEDLPFEFIFSEPCERTLFGRPPECLNCLAYSGGGTAINYQPSWWGE